MKTSPSLPDSQEARYSARGTGASDKLMLAYQATRIRWWAGVGAAAAVALIAPQGKGAVINLLPPAPGNWAGNSIPGTGDTANIILGPAPILDLNGVTWAVGKISVGPAIAASIIDNIGPAFVLNLNNTAGLNAEIDATGSLTVGTGVTLSNNLVVNGGGASGNPFGTDTGAVTLGGVVAGARGITVRAGTVTLNAVNTYTGQTQVDAGGSIILGASASIDASSAIVLNGVPNPPALPAAAANFSAAPGAGAIQVAAPLQIIEKTSFGDAKTPPNTRDIKFTGPVTLGTATTIVNNSVDVVGAGMTVTFGGVVSDTVLGVDKNTGALEKLGGGTLVLSGNNDFANGLIVTTGEVSVEHVGALGLKAAGVSGDVTLNGGVLRLKTDNAAADGWGGGTDGGSVGGLNTLKQSRVTVGTSSTIITDRQTTPTGADPDAAHVLGTLDFAAAGQTLTVIKGGSAGATGKVSFGNPDLSPLILGQVQFSLTGDTVELNGNSTMKVDAAVTVEFNGQVVNGTTPGTPPVSTVGTLIKTGAGTLNLNFKSGDPLAKSQNTYSGGTKVTGGELVLNSGRDNTLNTDGDITINGGNLDLGSQTQNASAKAKVTLEKGDVTNGILDKTGDYIEAKLTGTMTVAADAILQGSSGLKVSADPTGTDPRVLVLNGRAVQSGPTVVESATLKLGGTDRLSTSGNLIVTGGAFDLAGNSQKLNEVTLNGGELADTASGGKLTADQNFDLQSGVVNANLGDLSTTQKTKAVKTTSGKVTIKKSGTYTGGTDINGGMVEVALGVTSVGDTAGAITLQAGALAGEQGQTVTVGNALVLAGDVQLGQTGAGTTLAVSGQTTVSGDRSVTVLGTVKLTTPLAGDALRKKGAGTLQLNGATNTAITVDAGVLQAGGNNAFANTVTVNGGTVDVNGFGQALNKLTLVDGLITDAGTGTPGSVAATTFEVQNGSVGAKVQGASHLIKTSAGTVTVSNGANTYTGGTEVAAGALNVTANNGLGNGDILVSGGKLNLFANTQTATALTVGGGELNGGVVNASGAASISSGAVAGSTVNATGAVSLSGGNIDASTLSGSTVGITGGAIRGTTVTARTGAATVVGATVTNGTIKGVGVTLNGGVLNNVAVNATTGAATVAGATVTNGTISGASAALNSGALNNVTVAATTGAATVAGASVTGGAISALTTVDLTGGALTNVRVTATTVATASGATVTGGAINGATVALNSGALSNVDVTATTGATVGGATVTGGSIKGATVDLNSGVVSSVAVTATGAATVAGGAVNGGTVSGTTVTLSGGAIQNATVTATGAATVSGAAVTGGSLSGSTVTVGAGALSGVTVRGSTVSLNGGALTDTDVLATNVNLGGSNVSSGRIESANKINSSASATVGAALASANGLNHTAGNLILGGANTLLNGVTVAGGSVIAAVNGAFGSGNVDVRNNAVLDYAGTRQAGIKNLVVNGTLQSSASVLVESGQVLSGTGASTAVVKLDGGAIAPGNSGINNGFGTFTVAALQGEGDYLWERTAPAGPGVVGATVGTAGTNYDQIVTGSGSNLERITVRPRNTSGADIAVVNTTAGGESFARDQVRVDPTKSLTYSKIIAGSVTNAPKFGGADTAVIKIRMVRNDNPAAPGIDLVVDRSSYAEFANCKSGKAFGAYLDSQLAAKYELPTTVGQLLRDLDATGSVAEVSARLHAIDPSAAYASLYTVGIRRANAVGIPLEDHLDALGASAVGDSALQLATGVSKFSAGMITPSQQEDDKNWTAWTAGYGSRFRIDCASDCGGSIQSSDNGATLGLERRIGDLRIGALASIGQGSTNLDDPSVRVESDHWHVGGYGSVSFGAVTVDASALFGSSDESSTRSVVGGAAKGNFGSNDTQLGMGVALNLIPKSSGWQVTPVARVKYVSYKQDGFAETGPSGALLFRTASLSEDTVVSKVGLRVAHRNEISKGFSLGVDGAAYWVHDFNSEGRNLSLQAQGANGFFQATGRNGEANTAQLNLGVQATVAEAVTFRLSGQQEMGGNRSQSTGVVSVGWSF